MGRIGDKRTPKEIEEHLVASRATRMANASALAFDLLDHDINCFIEMHQITSHGDFFCFVYVDHPELVAERYDNLMEIANAHGAHISLRECNINQARFSRLALWVAGSED